MPFKPSLLLSVACIALGACAGAGSGGGGVAAPVTSTAAAPTPTPTPTPAQTNFDTEEYRRSNGLDNINALAAYDAGGTGEGVIIGVIDSGIDINSSEFAGRIHPSSTNTADPSESFQDIDGHGTFVASVAAGDNNGVWNHGVAFDAQILALRTDDQNSCNEDGCLHFDTDIAQALDVAISAGAKVSNISLGGESASFSFRAAVDRATDADMIIVIAAGNDGASEPDGFARVAEIPNAKGRVLIAGYVDDTNTIAASSNRAGSAADVFVVAPGVDIRATGLDDERFFVSGSSFSAPHVSGAIAVLYDLFPQLTADEMIDLITSTATDLGDPGVDAIYGHGLINLEAALEPQGSLQASIVAADGTLTSAPLDTSVQAPSAFGDALSAGLSSTRALSTDRFGRAYEVTLAPFAQTQTSQVAVSALLNSREIISNSALGFAGGAMFAQMSIRQDTPLDPALLAQFSGAFADHAAQRDVSGRVNLQQGAWALNSAFGVRPAALLEDASKPNIMSLAQTDAASFGIGAVAGANSFSVQYALSEAFSLQGGSSWQAQTFQSAFSDDDRSTRAQSTLSLLYRANETTQFAISLGATNENGQIFGAQASNGALSLGQGARTLFAEIGARYAFDARTDFIASTAFGAATLDPAAGASLLDVTGPLYVSSWDISLRRRQAFAANDSLWLTMSQPQRVESGSVSLTSPSANDVLSLSPSGRQIDAELAYQWAILGKGTLSANILMRRDVNHVAGQHDAASLIRYTSRF